MLENYQPKKKEMAKIGKQKKTWLKYTRRFKLVIHRTKCPNKPKMTNYYLKDQNCLNQIQNKPKIGPNARKHLLSQSVSRYRGHLRPTNLNFFGQVV